MGSSFGIQMDDEVVKSQTSDGTVKSSRCKARKSEGMRRTYMYAAMTEDAAERRRWTFCEAVMDELEGLPYTKHG